MKKYCRNLNQVQIIAVINILNLNILIKIVIKKIESNDNK